jgi:hypothetical protein
VLPLREGPGEPELSGSEALDEGERRGVREGVVEKEGEAVDEAEAVPEVLTPIPRDLVVQTVREPCAEIVGVAESRLVSDELKEGDVVAVPPSRLAEEVSVEFEEREGLIDKEGVVENVGETEGQPEKEGESEEEEELLGQREGEEVVEEEGEEAEDLVGTTVPLNAVETVPAGKGGENVAREEGVAPKKGLPVTLGEGDGLELAVMVLCSFKLGEADREFKGVEEGLARSAEGVEDVHLEAGRETLTEVVTVAVAVWHGDTVGNKGVEEGQGEDVLVLPAESSDALAKGEEEGDAVFTSAEGVGPEVSVGKSERVLEGEFVTERVG